MPNPFGLLIGSPWARQHAHRRTLLRTAVRGGLLRLSGAELVYGEGFLGSKNMRSVPLGRIESLLIEPGAVAVGGVRLRVNVVGELELLIEGVNAGAARRLIQLVQILRRA
jgi:hypothetical protein